MPRGSTSGVHSEGRGGGGVDMGARAALRHVDDATLVARARRIALCLWGVGARGYRRALGGRRGALAPWCDCLFHQRGAEYAQALFSHAKARWHSQALLFSVDLQVGAAGLCSQWDSIPAKLAAQIPEISKASRAAFGLRVAQCVQGVCVCVCASSLLVSMA